MTSSIWPRRFRSCNGTGEEGRESFSAKRIRDVRDFPPNKNHDPDARFLLYLQVLLVAGAVCRIGSRIGGSPRTGNGLAYRGWYRIGVGRGDPSGSAQCRFDRDRPRRRVVGRAIHGASTRLCRREQGGRRCGLGRRLASDETILPSQRVVQRTDGSDRSLQHSEIRIADAGAALSRPLDIPARGSRSRLSRDASAVSRFRASPLHHESLSLARRGRKARRPLSADGPVVRSAR